MIDGFTHQIMALKCSIDNKALTLLIALDTSQGMMKYGLPDLIRGDAGMENVAIARLINYINGVNHFLIGRSVYNQRIERLWNDVFSNVIIFYHDLFTELYLPMDHTPENTWVLQYLFLDRINEDLQTFIESWNNYSMSTCKGMSPDKQYLLAEEHCYRDNRARNDQNMRNIVEGLEEEYEGKKCSVSTCPFINEEEILNFNNLVSKLTLRDNIQTINERIEHAFTVAVEIVLQRV